MAEPLNKQLYEDVKEKIMKSYKKNSAFASGAIVKEYKRQGGKYKSTGEPRKLKRWFDEKWIDIKTNKPCGAVHNSKYYPTCRPKIKITNESPVIASKLSKKEKESMIKQKQKAKKKTVNYKETKNKI